MAQPSMGLRALVSSSVFGTKLFDSQVKVRQADARNCAANKIALAQRSRPLVVRYKEVLVPHRSPWTKAKREAETEKENRS